VVVAPHNSSHSLKVKRANGVPSLPKLESSWIEFDFFARCLVAFVLSSLCEDGVGGFLMLGYQKSSPTHPILTQLRTAVMAPENFTHTIS
jgi:hypothetical protein